MCLQRAGEIRHPFDVQKRGRPRRDEQQTKTESAFPPKSYDSKTSTGRDRQILPNFNDFPTQEENLEITQPRLSTDAVPPSPGVLTVIERKLPLPRSRIGTTTSQETSSLDHPTCIESRGLPDSFEEELFLGLSRDKDDENEDVIGKNIIYEIVNEILQ